MNKYTILLLVYFFPSFLFSVQSSSEIIQFPIKKEEKYYTLHSEKGDLLLSEFYEIIGINNFSNSSFININEYDYKINTNNNTIKFSNHKILLKFLKNTGYITNERYAFDFLPSLGKLSEDDRQNIYIGGIPKSENTKMKKISFPFIQNPCPSFLKGEKITQFQILSNLVDKIGFEHKNGSIFEYNDLSEREQLVGIIDPFLDYQEFCDLTMGVSSNIKSIFVDYILYYLMDYIKEIDLEHKYVKYRLNADGMNKFPNIFLKIGNETISELFDKGLENPKSEMDNYDENYYTKNLMLGFGFMRKFDFVEFDYENNQVNFYKKENIENNKMYYFFVGVVVFLWITCPIFWWRNMKLKIAQKEYDYYFNI